MFASGFVMHLLQLTAVTDNMWFWMKEWVGNYTNLPHYNDSSGRICFGFLIYPLFCYYYPTLCSDDRGVVGNRQKLLLGAFVKSLMQAAWTWWWFIDDQVQQTTPFPGVQNNLVTLFFLPVISCSELLISSVVSCLRSHSLVPGQYEPWCSWKKSFSCSFQPRGKKGLGFSDRDRLPWYGRLLVK